MSALAEASEPYHVWLRDLLSCDGRTDHNTVLEEMACYEFIARHPFDANRFEDVQRQLRNLYSEDEVVGPCTVLEVMIVVCQRFAEKIGTDTFGITWTDIFWDALMNLGLYLFDDSICATDPKALDYVRDIIVRFVDRDYDYNGCGGAWPLLNPRDDARKNDLMRQLGLYFSEHFTFDD